MIRISRSMCTCMYVCVCKWVSSSIVDRFDSDARRIGRCHALESRVARSIGLEYLWPSWRKQHHPGRPCSFDAAELRCKWHFSPIYRLALWECVRRRVSPVLVRDVWRILDTSSCHHSAQSACRASFDRPSVHYWSLWILAPLYHSHPCRVAKDGTGLPALRIFRPRVWWFDRRVECSFQLGRLSPRQDVVLGRDHERHSKAFLWFAEQYRNQQTDWRRTRRKNRLEQFFECLLSLYPAKK